MTLAIDGGRPMLEGMPEPMSWPPRDDGLADALAKYVRAGLPMSISDGSGVIGELEERLSAELGLPQVLTASSGTAALHMAYIALNLPAGGEVIGPALTFHASLTPAAHCGLTPVLVDVDPLTANITPDAIERALTPRTVAVVVHHNWGHPAPVQEIRALCDRHGIALIEDCSHAYLSSEHGDPVGTYGHVAVFSMQGSKALPAGEGGFLATADEAVFDRALLAGHYRGRGLTKVRDPQLRRFGDSGFGLKYRLHPLVAVAGLHHLARLRERMAARMVNLDRLSTRLESIPGIEPPKVRDGVKVGGWFGYKPAFRPGDFIERDAPVSQDRYLQALKAEGMSINPPSVAPLYELPAFTESLPWRGAPNWRPRISDDLSGCRAYMRHRLSIPVFSSLDDSPLADAYADAFEKVATAFVTGNGDVR